MDAKKWLTGTVVGGIVLWLLGMLIWQVLFSDFFTANAGGATDLVREAPIYWAGIVGTLAISALVTTALGWDGSLSLSGGFKVGATVGFLLWFGELGDDLFRQAVGEVCVPRIGAQVVEGKHYNGFALI